MENRRQTYRHPFNPHESLRVELQLPGKPGSVPCEMVDLSLGGMRVVMKASPASLTVGDAVVANLLGRDTPEPVELSLALPARVVYLEQTDQGLQCGVHFLPTANPALNEEIERTLARFLMAEQRRKRWLRDQQQKRRIS